MGQHERGRCPLWAAPVVWSGSEGYGTHVCVGIMISSWLAIADRLCLIRNKLKGGFPLGRGANAFLKVFAGKSDKHLRSERKCNL